MPNSLILATCIFLGALTCGAGCSSPAAQQQPPATTSASAPAAAPADTSQAAPLLTGAQQTNLYLPLLQGKQVALVVNQTSTVGGTHLVDTLLAAGIAVTQIFAPEHGFRGNVDRGATVKDGTDTQTGLPLTSLYGKNKKPTPAQLQGIGVVVFDIQDVGARFYTYISTMHYVMEACAENGVPLVVLDRPNPNGDAVDGPVREAAYTSFVGMHPIPVVHGLTVGELALMINGQGWLADSAQCPLTVVPVANYTHSTRYALPIKPSPNLPNYQSVRLYPSLCLFEATKVSVGRGTPHPFQVLGYPDSAYGSFTFVPQDVPGVQTGPVQEGQTCYGLDLRQVTPQAGFSLQYLTDFYKKSGYSNGFVSNERWFNLLAGNATLLQQLKAQKTATQIRASWQPALQAYKAQRKQYLLYPDFE